MFDEGVPFFEATLVEQQFDALARGQFAARMLFIDARLPATVSMRACPPPSAAACRFSSNWSTISFMNPYAQ
jgi:hypothetical protein